MDWFGWLPATRSDVSALTGKASALMVAVHRLEEAIVASKQETIDAMTASVQQVSTTVSEIAARALPELDAVRQDIADIKAAGNVDTSALESSVGNLATAVAPLTTLADNLAALNAENPELPPVEPTPDPEPTPEPPVEEFPAPPVEDTTPVEPAPGDGTDRTV